MFKTKAPPLSDVVWEGLSPADRAVFNQPTTGIATAGRLLGVARVTADKAVRLGHIPTILVGGRRRVPTAWLLATLRHGLSEAA